MKETTFGRSPTSFAKIFEKVMHITLLGHLNEHNILGKHQFGFRTNLRTESAIFKLTSEILRSLNHGLLVGGIFCDLQSLCESQNIVV